MPTPMQFTLPTRRFALALMAIAAFAAGNPRTARAQGAPATLDPEEAARLSVAKPEPGKKGASTEGEISEARELERFKVFRQSIKPEKRSESEFRIKALEGFIDYDEEEKVLYGPERTRVEYGDFVLEADKLIFDNRLQEVQAEGNVVMKSNRGDLKKDEIKADSMRYNFLEGEGVAYHISGQHAPAYFKSAKTPDPNQRGLPDFQKVSEAESIFHHTEVTGCDFKVPHYYLRAREVILFTEDRIFFRGATFYVFDTPMMYLPFYTRSMKEPSPWFVQMGYGSRSGARMRFGYEYEHETKEPNFLDESKYDTRSAGQAQTFTDFLSKRGFGAGFDYRYNLDFDRHTGEFEIYGFEDYERKVAADLNNLNSNATKSESERSQILWKHRTTITKHLTATVNVDWFSDPEIFYDVLDFFADDKIRRDRQVERKAQAALTYLREAWVARLLVDVRDRIGIDRYGNPSNPADDDRTLDFDPRTSIKNTNADGVGKDRWGRVSEKAPEFNFATRYLPIKDWPLFLLTRGSLYNNLDRGLNIVGSGDDARVTGGEFYTQLMWQHRFSDRYTLLAKLGVGAGGAERSDNNLGTDLHHHGAYDTIVLDPSDPTGNTFIVGTKKFNYNDVQRFQAWVDSEVRFSARFSDALSGFLAWRWRESTSNNLGDFYAQVGDRLIRQDLYNYQLRENWVLSNLTYTLLYPRMTVFANTGYNLESAGSLYPHEDTYFWNTGANWTSLGQTLKLSGLIGGSGRQVLNPSDPGEGIQNSTYVEGTLGYVPLHGRWWTRLRVGHNTTKGRLVEQSNADQYTYFTQEDTKTKVGILYGHQLGPKWNTEVEMTWDDQVNGLRDARWILQRDMHDALAVLRVRTQQDVSSSTSRNDNKQQFDVSFGLKFKLPGQELGFGPRDVKTLKQSDRQPAVAQ